MKPSAILLTAVIAGLAGTASADSIQWQPVGSGTASSGSDDYNGSSVYQSTSGNRYQYDLNKPTDRIRYEHDAGAQIRDRYNPRTEIDRNQGQLGGGIYND